MKITVTRSGGFGGLTRTWSLEVSRTEAEQRWLPLAEAEAHDTAEDHAPEAAAGNLQRDRFTYRIAIGYTEVQFPESELDDPWRELVDRAREATSARQTPQATPPTDDTGGGKGGPGPTPELL